MTLDELKRCKVAQLPENVVALAGLQNPKRQPNVGGQSQNRSVEASPRSVGFRITIVSCRRKRIDEHDNLRTGAKPLADRITSYLGFRSDDDPRLHWEYGQIETRGQEGVIVKIESVLTMNHRKW